MTSSPEETDSTIPSAIDEGAVFEDITKNTPLIPPEEPHITTRELLSQIGETAVSWTLGPLMIVCSNARARLDELRGRER